MHICAPNPTHTEATLLHKYIFVTFTKYLVCLTYFLRLPLLFLPQRLFQNPQYDQKILCNFFQHQRPEDLDETSDVQ